MRPNVYNIYRRESLDTELLQRLSVILGHNFLKDLAQETEQQIKEETWDFFNKELCFFQNNAMFYKLLEYKGAKTVNFLPI